jgi:hypothetical protein
VPGFVAAGSGGGPAGSESGSTLVCGDPPIELPKDRDEFCRDSFQLEAWCFFAASAAPRAGLYACCRENLVKRINCVCDGVEEDCPPAASKK